MESLKNLKNQLDRGATYFWAKSTGTGYRLVNAFTLKTATGVEARLDALRLTRALINDGYAVAKLEDKFDV